MFKLKVVAAFAAIVVVPAEGMVHRSVRTEPTAARVTELPEAPSANIAHVDAALARVRVARRAAHESERHGSGAALARVAHRPIRTEPLGVTVGASVAESAPPEDDQLARAEVEELLTALEARIATVAAQRECAPRVDLLAVAGLFRASMDPPLSRVEARRLMKGVVELERLVEFYAVEAEALCETYHEAERISAEFARVLTVAEEHLMRAATAIQSRMPSSAAELDTVLSFRNTCYRPSAHVNSTMIAVQNRTPFQAMKRFVHVADDGVIRARRNRRSGADVVDYFDRFTGGWFVVRNHTYLAAHAWISGFEFHLCVKRKGKEWSGDHILASGKNSAAQGLELSKSATIAHIVIGRLVRDARRFAAASCASTVQSGARLARVFQANTPRSADAKRMYADAARWMRAEVESIAATGAADLCNGRNADLRALAGPAVEAAAGVTDPSATDYFRDDRSDAESVLLRHARKVRAAFLMGN